MTSRDKLVDESVRSFRLASRDIYNLYFFSLVAAPRTEKVYSTLSAFQRIEDELFRVLVSDVATLKTVPYRDVQAEIKVSLVDSLSNEPAPVSINRHVDSGYWDYPVKRVPREALLLFVSFFDWDQNVHRDNQLVRVVIADWPALPDVIGRHALIEARHVRYGRRPLY